MMSTMASECETRFTAISLSPETPQAIERREQRRYIAVLQAGKIVTAHGEELCLIRNISAAGMMAHVYGPLEDGERVAVEFKVGESVPGEVVWLDEAMAGIRFDTRVDLHKVMSPRRDPQSGMAPRAPRLNVCGLALVQHAEQDYGAQVLDISQGGVKVEAAELAEYAQAGEDVVVSMAGLPACPGVVRWVEGAVAGIAFNRTLPLDQIALWAVAQTPRTVRGRAGN